MSVVRFGLLADQDIYKVLTFEDSSIIAEKWIAGLRSGGTLVDVTKYGEVKNGYLVNNGMFFEPTDENFSSPIGESVFHEDVVFRYALVMEDVVVGLMSFVQGTIPDEIVEMLKIGMSSNGGYVELPSDNIQEGWKYDGTDFIEPGE
jgi:hypothetical protein